MILAGDVGGTKTTFGLFRRTGGRTRVVREHTYDSRSVNAFEDLLEDFLGAGRERPKVCAFGVAGPIDDGRSTRVNLPWSVDARRLVRSFRFDRVRVLNDLEATAWGIPELARSKIRTLTPNVRARVGTAGLVAAGTGLGTAVLHNDGRRTVPGAAEGGHSTWGPPDAGSIRLWERLARLHGRVELEHVVSGPGLGAVFDDVVAGASRRLSRKAERSLRAAEDRNAEIARLALERVDRLAVEALDRFVRYYGAAAGDFALSVGAVGGIWVAGGIAPKILDRLVDGPFVHAFRDKGRLSEYMARIPVRVVLESRCALIGAAAYARAQDGSETFSRRRGRRPATSNR